MHSVLILISILGLAGILFLSEATSGVGVIALGILFAAWARIAQANKHHSETLAAINSRKELAED